MSTASTKTLAVQQGTSAKQPQGIDLPSHVVSLKNITVAYEKSNFELQVPQLTINHGERVALLGSSGSGKTTLLRVLNGMVPINQGELKLFGEVSAQDLNHRLTRRRIAFIFQRFNLVERATVYENVLWGRLGWRSTLASLFSFNNRDHKSTQEAIREVNLEAQALQRVSQLSGGQQQRVGIARALVQEPDLILADEPVSNLDAKNAEDIMLLLTRASESHGVTLIMSLHQTDLAEHYASRIVTLDGGQLIADNSRPTTLVQDAVSSNSTPATP